jgi:tetratricopeptide (TPR) repeat protein
MVIRRLAFALALLLGPSVALAAPPKAKAPAAGGKEEFDRAVKLYQAQEYGQACPLFERAVELSGRRPSSLRALAQCERARKNNERAIAVFKEYLASKPSDAAQVEETIRVLEKERAQVLTPAIPEPGAPPPSSPIEPPAPVVSAPPPAPTRPEPQAAPASASPAQTQAQLAVTPAPARPMRVAPWVVVGGAALVGGGGAVLLALGKGDASSVENAPAGSAFADVQGAADRAPMMMTLGTVLIGVGAAGISAGVAWLFLGDDQ